MLGVVFVAGPEAFRARIEERLAVEQGLRGDAELVYRVRQLEDKDPGSEIQGWLRQAGHIETMRAVVAWADGPFPWPGFKELRDAIAGLVAAFPMLAAWHPEVVIRTRDRITEELREGLQALLGDHQSFGGAFRLQRLWLLGPTNGVAGRPGVVLDDPGLDALLAEAIVLLLCHPGLFPTPDPRRPLASLGAARVAYDIPAIQAWCSARAAARLLGAYLRAPLDDAEAREQGRSLVTGLPLGTAGRGLTASRLVSVLYQPAVLEPSRPAGPPPTVVEQVNFDDLRVPSDVTGPVEKTLALPFAIVNHAEQVLMREVSRLAREVARAAGEVEGRARAWIAEEANRWARMPAGFPGLGARLGALREALESERGAVARARDADPDWLTAIVAAIARKLGLEAAGPAEATDTDALRDAMIRAHDDLATAIERRPLAVALLTRQVLAALVVAWPAAAVGPTLGPWIGVPPEASSSPVCFGIAAVVMLAPSALRILRYRAYLRRCEGRLYAAVLRYARGLLRRAILDEAHRLFGRLLAFVGRPEDRSGENTVYGRATRLRETVEKAIAVLDQVPYAPRIRPSAVQRCPVDEVAAQRLCLRDNPTTDWFETAAEFSAADGGLRLDPAPDPTEVSNSARAYCQRVGFSWVDTTPPVDLAAKTGMQITEVTQFLAATSQVYCPVLRPLETHPRVLVTQPRGAIGGLRPPGTWTEQAAEPGYQLGGVLALQIDPDVSADRSPFLQQVVSSGVPAGPSTPADESPI